MIPELFTLFVLWATPMLRAYWPPLAVLEVGVGPYGVPAIEPPMAHARQAPYPMYYLSIPPELF